MNCFSFRVRKRYFDAIVKGEKTVEYRRDIPFWRIRVVNVVDDPEFTHDVLCTNKEIEPRSIDADGVFICGKRIHRRKVIAISRIKTPAISLIRERKMLILSSVSLSIWELKSNEFMG